MFDISWTEFLLIGVVALIAIGPKELPGVLRTAGQWMGKVRRMAAEFQGQFHEAMREAEMADLKKEVDAITESAHDLKSSLKKTASIENLLTPPKPPAPTEPISGAPPPPLAAGSPTAENTATETHSDAAPPPGPVEPSAPPPAPVEHAAPPPTETAPTPAPVDVHVPLPEPLPPVTEKDFATATAPAPTIHSPDAAPNQTPSTAPTSAPKPREGV